MSTPTKPTWTQKLLVFLRSTMVGAGAVVLDIGSLSLMVRVFGWSPEAANVPSLVLGMIWMFFGNKYFAFHDHSRNLARQGGKFLAIEFVAILLNIGFFHFLVTKTGLVDYPEIARAIGTNITYLCFSYPLWTLLVFRYEAPAEETPS